MKRSATPEEMRFVLRFVHYQEIEGDARTRYVVGGGDHRCGLRGQAHAIVGLKHAQGYEVVLALDDGTFDSFAPRQLFPETVPATAASLPADTH